MRRGAAELPRRGSGHDEAEELLRRRSRGGAVPARRGGAPGADAARRPSRGGAEPVRRGGAPAAVHPGRGGAPPTSRPRRRCQRKLRTPGVDGRCGLSPRPRRRGGRPPELGKERGRRLDPGGMGERGGAGVQTEGRDGDAGERVRREGRPLGRLLENTMFGFRTSLLCSTQKM